ncbi:MAG TPA: RluA family pseudouridine synthase [Paracoccaceae bacterium]|nr:RluA family pseudouridine synthase [Paracoccaceae bacterium]
MGGSLRVVLPEGCEARLDKALAGAVPAEAALSRSRLRGLIEEGAVARADGTTVREPGAKVKPGEAFEILLPEPVAATPAAEAIRLDILYEDAELIVVNKPAGMVVHPAPGAEQGTLVNALLHHCGESLQGIGGERRPGIVHRIDKDTSGLLVAAKTAAAHHGLARLFARHEVERVYRALVWGVPDRADPRFGSVPGVTAEPGWIRIEAAIGRHPSDRKRMAVAERGRAAVTRFRVLEQFGTPPAAALVECRLETGRTHQIRVHLAHVGHPLVGDPVYGRRRRPARGALPEAAAAALGGFSRQALHAGTLGFVHPVTGRQLRFEAPLPPDLDHLVVTLRTV